MSLTCNYDGDMCHVVRGFSAYSLSSTPPASEIICTAETEQLALQHLALAIIGRQKVHFGLHGKYNGHFLEYLKIPRNEAAAKVRVESVEADVKLLEDTIKGLDNLEKDLKKAKHGITMLPKSVREILKGFDEAGAKVRIRNRRV